MKYQSFQLLTKALLLSFLFSLFIIAGLSQPNELQKKHPPLFASEELLKLKITGDVKRLIRDKGKSDEYYPVTLNYTDGDSTLAIDMKARLRGHFRRESGTCNLPPILLNFPKNDTVKHSVFSKQDKLKLVVTCIRGDYVQREYLAYKIYQLLSPYSFDVRLVEITFEGEKLSKSEATPFIGYLIEADEDVAKSVDGKLLPEDEQYQIGTLNIESYLTVIFFEYLIANVDWSVQFQHNMRLVVPSNGGQPMVIPYDFDHSGLVGAPYAQPPVELNMTSVKERRYRGACDQNTERIKKIVSLFNSKKQDILNLYLNTNIVSEDYKKTAIKFLEEFYTSINDVDQLSKIVSTNCDPSAGGNIIISGLPKKEKE